MKRTLILTLSVLLCTLALCTISQRAVNAAVDGALDLRNRALLAADGDDPAPAAELMTRLAEFWEDRAPLMELVASHDALHEAGTAIAEARICLECNDHDDFLRTMSNVQMALEHLKDEQAVKWGNLY